MILDIEIVFPKTSEQISSFGCKVDGSWVAMVFLTMHLYLFDMWFIEDQGENIVRTRTRDKNVYK